MRGFITFIVIIILVACAPLLFLYGDELGIMAFFYSATVFPGLFLYGCVRLFQNRNTYPPYSPRWFLVRTCLCLCVLGVLMFAYLWYAASDALL
jgi:hypothetical protein